MKMSDNKKPLFSLTIGEYMELNRELLAEQNRRNNATQNVITPSKEESDIIQIKEVARITCFMISTIHTKVSKGEIPTHTRGKPLLFSKKIILKWLDDGCPKSFEQKAEEYMIEREASIIYNTKK